MSVREPEPQGGDPGAIYLWLLPLDERVQSANPLDYVSPGREPRAYRLDYSRLMHMGLERAKGAIGQGRPVVLDLRGRGQGGEGAEGEGGPGQGDDAEGGANGPGGPPGYGYDPTRRDFQIYELPPPHPPGKRED